MQIIRQYQIDVLFHITKLSNLKRILEYGLLCHKKAHNKINRHIFDLSVSDISDQDVQKIRKDKLLNQKSLHEYVCLYLNPKNPMLLKRKQWQQELIILGIDSELLTAEGVYFSNGNAAAYNTEFYNDLECLALIDWHILRSEQSWAEHPDGKRIKCAEVLVPFTVSPEKIKQIFCYNTKQVQIIEQILQELDDEKLISLEVNKNLFF